MILNKYPKKGIDSELPELGIICNFEHAFS